MIKVEEIKKIEGLYKSVLYKDYYAVDLFVERDGIEFKIRYPYNNQVSAEQAMNAMKLKKQSDIPVPDYKPCIWRVDVCNKKAR